jgi:hypothetical protein
MGDDSQMQSHNLQQGFSFSATRIDQLGATEYTLVTIGVDETGSVAGYEDPLRNTLITAVEACKKSPHADNLLVRVITFSSRYPNGVNEVHGFKLLGEIDSSAYPWIRAGGNTPLCDACYSTIGAMNKLGEELSAQDFGVNGISFILTDGAENASSTSMRMVKEEAARAVTGETMESMITILVGFNATQYRRELELFQKDAGITEYVDAGEATPGRLARLAAFVSQSVSSQAQARGTGGPSQNISATI